MQIRSFPSLVPALVEASSGLRNICVRRLTFISTSSASGVIRFTDSLTGNRIGMLVVTGTGPFSLELGRQGARLSPGASLLQTTSGPITGRLFIDSIQVGPLPGPTPYEAPHAAPPLAPVKPPPPTVEPEPVIEFTQLQIIFPGEALAPGVAGGKIGTPDPQVAGVPFTVYVYAVDNDFNIATGTTDLVQITSSDVRAVLPLPRAFLADLGLVTFQISLLTAGSATATATNLTTTSMASDVSASSTVTAGPFVQLQVLLPGEFADTTKLIGKTGTPQLQIANTPFNVTVHSTDLHWNIVSSSHAIGITSSDGAAVLPSNASLSSGTNIFSVTLNTQADQTITATDITDGSKTPGVSAAVTVNAAAGWILVASTEQKTPNGFGFTTTGIDTTGANLLILAVCIDKGQGATQLTSLTDNKGNTFTEKTRYATPLAFGAIQISFWVCESPTVGTGHTITTAGAGSPNHSIAFLAYSGSIGIGSTDIVVGTFTGAGTNLTSPLLTPSTANALVITAFGLPYGAGILANTSVDSGFSSDIGVDSAATVHGVTWASLVTSSAVSPKWTWTASGSKNAAITTASFLSGSGSGTPFTKLQVLMPGETAAPGTESGKTGTPDPQVAGTSFNITVNSVDANWNVISTVDTIAITSTDQYATLPGNAALIAGTKVFAVTLKTASSTTTVTASDVTRATKTPNTSPATTVAAAAFTKLQLLLPGQIAAPGSATGYTNSATAEAIGAAFSPIVNAVDANWNVVSSTHTVGITGGGAGVSLPANHALVAGTWTFTNGVTMNEAGSQTLTATNITDGTKTASSVNVSCGAVLLLQASDFTYLGCCLVPTQASATFTLGFANGNLTGRIVAGQQRLFMTGHAVAIGNADAAYEVRLPETLAPNYATAIAGGTTYRSVFTNQYNSTIYTNKVAAAQGANGIRVRGLLWYNNKLIWTYLHDYSAQATDPCIGFAIPGPDGSNTATAYGTWVANTTLGPRHAGGYMCVLPASFLPYVVGPIGYGNYPASSSGGGTPSGVFCVPGIEPTTSMPADPVGTPLASGHITCGSELAGFTVNGVSQPMPTSVQRALCGYNSAGSLDCSAGFFGPIAAKPVFGPSSIDAWTPPPGFVRPEALYIDLIRGLVFINTSTRQGVVAIGQIADAILGTSYGTDNKPHVGYWPGPPSPCCHGMQDPLVQTVGPHCTGGTPPTPGTIEYATGSGRANVMWIWDQDDWLDVAKGLATSTSLVHTSLIYMGDITGGAIPTGNVTHGLGAMSGLHFESTTGKLYVLENGREHVNTNFGFPPVIHVFQLPL